MITIYGWEVWRIRYSFVYLYSKSREVLSERRDTLDGGSSPKGELWISCRISGQ